MTNESSLPTNVGSNDQLGPNALAYARARVSMLGAAEYMDTVNQALDEHARVLDKANSYIADNARLAEQVEDLRAELARLEAAAKHAYTDDWVDDDVRVRHPRA